MTAIGHIVVHIDRMRIADMQATEVDGWLELCAATLRDALADCYATPTRSDVERSVHAAFARGAQPGVRS